MSEKRWVFNASPIISLCKIDRAGLLCELCDDIVIPSGVADEIDQGPVNDPAKTWLDHQGRNYVKDVGAISTVISAWDLGKGETEVINWAYTHSGYEVILDDLAARNCAFSLNLQVVGTIGIIVLAKKHGKIKAATPLLEKLVQNGFRVNPELMKLAIQLAGEASK